MAAESRCDRSSKLTRGHDLQDRPDDRNACLDSSAESARSRRASTAELAVGSDGGDVAVVAEVVEQGSPVGEQVADDDQDGAGDRDQGLELTAAG
jgi:hypothetical protein